MAKKRMFSLLVIDTDAFLDMPLSAQALYFHLCMRADDDGFIGNPKRIMRLINASEDDLKILLAKGFVIRFDEVGVLVVKHWRIHNTIQSDRYTRTIYSDELNRLCINDNKSYALMDGGNKLETNRKQIVPADKGIDKGLEEDQEEDSDIEQEELRRDTEEEKNISSASKKALETRKARELFEHLWSLYPKKRGKSNVSDTKKKQLLAVGRENMEAAIANYIDEIERNHTDMQYVKHGSSFFNGAYVDYLPENFSPLPVSRPARGSRGESVEDYMRRTEGWERYADDYAGIQPDQGDHQE